MDSRELGLLLAQQLFQVDDLHYGLWDEGETPTIAAMPIAQERYNGMLLAQLASLKQGARVLDIGCGTGKLLTLLNRAGFQAEGLVPSSTLARLARERLAREGASQCPVHEHRFESFPTGSHRQAFDAAVFSESFQYIPMEKGLAQLGQLVRPGGTVIICDFFRTDAHGDGGPGDGTFGGGHPLKALHPALERAGLRVLSDTDLTRRISPNLALVDEILTRRALPASGTIHRYLSVRYPRSWQILLWVFRKKLAKMRTKYLSGHRTPTVFERYKSYRLVVCEKLAA